MKERARPELRDYDDSVGPSGTSTARKSANLSSARLIQRRRFVINFESFRFSLSGAGLRSRVAHRPSPLRANPRTFHPRALFNADVLLSILSLFVFLCPAPVYARELRIALLPCAVSKKSERRTSDAMCRFPSPSVVFRTSLLSSVPSLYACL
jgi:hypothetical protein